MKILLSLMIAFSATIAVANQLENYSGEAVYLDTEEMTLADEDGVLEQKQCPASHRPVVVCKRTHGVDPTGGGRIVRCRKGYHFCRSSFPNRSRCVPNSKSCGK